MALERRPGRAIEIDPGQHLTGWTARFKVFEYVDHGSFRRDITGVGCDVAGVRSDLVLEVGIGGCPVEYLSGEFRIQGELVGADESRSAVDIDGFQRYDLSFENF